MSRKTPGEVRARTCGTKSPSRSEALRFIDSSKSPSTKPSFEEIIPRWKDGGRMFYFSVKATLESLSSWRSSCTSSNQKRLVVISNTSPEQYRQDGMVLKHCSVMPESIEKTCIQPESYVIIDDIRIMGLKHGNQRECLYKFFTMYTHHYKLNVFFLSQSFDNVMDMKINTRFLYRFRFTDKTNIKRYIDTLFGGKCIKSNLIYRLYEKLLDNCERPVLAIDCSRNQYFTYCNGTSQAVHFE